MRERAELLKAARRCLVRMRAAGAEPIGILFAENLRVLNLPDAVAGIPTEFDPSLRDDDAYILSRSVLKPSK